MIVCPSVVFPQPDSPTRPKVSPRLTEKETSSTARMLSPLPPINPPPILKYFLRLTILRISSVSPPTAFVPFPCIVVVTIDQPFAATGVSSTTGFPVGPGNQHATYWPGLVSTNGGTSSHFGWRRGHRGRKRHPFG